MQITCDDKQENKPAFLNRDISFKSNRSDRGEVSEGREPIVAKPKLRRWQFSHSSKLRGNSHEAGEFFNDALGKSHLRSSGENSR